MRLPMARAATYFCVDIECSGPVPGEFDMISLGCVPVVADVDPGGGPSRYRVVDAQLYVEIRPTAPHVDPGAMKVNKLDIEALRREGLPLADALARLDTFVAAQVLAGTTPVFVGHNAPFDWSFVSHAYHVAGRRNPFGYKALDTKALSMGVLGVHWLDTHKEMLAERLPLPPVIEDQVHRADYDAWYQAHILVGLLHVGKFREGSR